MSDCRFGVSPVNYPDPDPERRSCDIEKENNRKKAKSIAKYTQRH